MKVTYGGCVWEWMPDEQILFADYPCSGETAGDVFSKEQAPRELRETALDLVAVSIKLEEMATWIEKGINSGY